MKMRKCIGLLLALTVAVGSFGISALAVEPQASAEPISAIERASGHFNTNVSSGKIMKLGSAISLRSGEFVSFDATYTPSDASVDFGVLDSSNAFIFINVSDGSVNDGVEIAVNGSYTPAIRNNSSSSISVSGEVATGFIKH